MMGVLMPPVVYVVRSPLHTLSHALFSGDGSAVVLSVEDPLLAAKVLCRPEGTKFKEGERLSYEQMLALVLESAKVMTL
jgi:hypothetical protein